MLISRASAEKDGAFGSNFIWFHSTSDKLSYNDKRRSASQFRLSLVLACVCLVGALFCGETVSGDEWGSLPTTQDTVTKAKRPNFVWLISEDNSKHYLKLYDSTGAATPHIAGLARDGLLFNHAFSNSPVCSVARTTLLTSCYATRIGAAFHRRSKHVPMPEGVLPFPQYLRKAGYYTTNRRKTDYNVKLAGRVWDESSNRASWRNRESGQPFFHKQSFTTTHEGSLHFRAGDLASRPTTTDQDKVSVAPYHPNTELFRYTNARYRDQMVKLDQQIGEVVKQLKSDGLLESTFIFYFGDHGGVLPRSKGYVYESGLHVPLVVRIPEEFKHLVDRKRNTKVDGFVSFIDFGPTLLKLAGVELPTKIDGRPFLGSGVTAREVDQQQTTFGYADRFDEKYDLVRSVRVGKYKYIRNFQPYYPDGLQNNYRYRMLAYAEWRKLYQTGKLSAVQSQFFRSKPAEALYDLERDPHETRNLAADPALQKTLKQLRDRLATHCKETRDLGFFPESLLYEKAFDRPTKFGMDQAKRIEKMIEIANWSLPSFEEVRGNLERALKSPDEWSQYWALITCASHGKQAAEFSGVAEKIAGSHANRMVRLRAVEFLALAGQSKSAAVLVELLNETQSPVEAAMILNTVVMLRDRGLKLGWETTALKLAPRVANDQNVKRRLEYLNR